MKSVSGRKNGEKKWPLGFDFWNGWWRLKMKKNGISSHIWLQKVGPRVGPKLKWNELK